VDIVDAVDLMGSAVVAEYKFADYDYDYEHEHEHEREQ